MSAEYPVTLREWKAYVRSLSRTELFQQAKSINRMAFVTMLRREGLDSRTIGGIFRLFAERMQELDIQPPARGPGGYLNYHDLYFQTE